MKPGKRTRHSFIMVRHDIYDSDAFQSLSPVARCVWMEIVRRYKGHNNGKIILSCREVSLRLRVSKDTASRAFNELIDVGLVSIARHGAFHVKISVAREWKLNHESCDNRPPTNEWRKFKIRSD